jgi:hypothetical protein
MSWSIVFSAAGGALIGAALPPVTSVAAAAAMAVVAMTKQKIRNVTARITSPDVCATVRYLC